MERDLTLDTINYYNNIREGQTYVSLHLKGFLNSYDEVDDFRKALEKFIEAYLDELQLPDRSFYLKMFF